MKEFIKTKVKPRIPQILGLTGLIVFYAIVGCPLRYFFGICCPGCGMTRASLAILQFDFIKAFRLHPLIFIMPICVLVYLLRKKMPKKLYNAFITFGIFLFIGVYVYRLLSGSEYVFWDPTRGLIYQIFNFFKSISGGF